MKSDLIEIEMAIRHRTDRAVLASADGERAVWLPLALVEIEPKGRTAIVTMPEWLAVEKGLA